MTDHDIEPVEAFAARARAWLAQNMEKLDAAGEWRGLGSDEEELAFVAAERERQRRLYDDGFAGLCFPREYGGQGLTEAHQRAFDVESRGYVMPTIIDVPTIVPCGVILLEFGTEEQKRTHIPPMLRGEQLWMQFLSEPSGGSDVAGALTTAVRDGDEWVINGSKIWTTGAWWSDMGLVLLRTNWDVPKHRGLSVFVLKIDQPGIEVQRIEMINGSKEFCQEFITDVRVPDTDRVGDLDDGWTVGRRWMFHERAAMGSGSKYVSSVRNSHVVEADTTDPLVERARATGKLDDPYTRDLIGEARALQRAGIELSKRIGEGMAAGVFNEHDASVARLMTAVVGQRVISINLEVAGSAAAGWAEDDGAAGLGTLFLMRQMTSIGGGTTEMARNNIAERVLGMPRERTHDKDVSFRDVPKGPPTR